MKVGISGPILVSELKKFLYSEHYRRGRNIGLGGSQVNQICIALLERGYDLTVFSLAEEVQEEVVLDGPHLRVCIGPYRSSGWARALDFFHTERRYLKNAVQREAPDLVHAHWTYEFALGPMATSVPVLTTVRDWAPQILWRIWTPYRLFRLFMAVWVFARGRHFTSNSEYIREQVERWTPHRAPVIPNGLHSRYFSDASKSPDLKSPTIISVNGGFGKLKNVHTLLRAYSEVRAQKPEATLQLIGGQYGEGGAAHEWSRKRGLCEGVEFVGQVDHKQVIRSLRDADLLVHPSLEESFGNTLVEAMAQGTPVVGGEESGAVPWVLDSGNAGLLTDVTEPASLAACIRRILNSKELWRSYSEAGYKRAHSTFQLSQIIDRYIEVYEEMITPAR